LGRTKKKGGGERVGPCQLWALGVSKFQNYFFGTSQADWRIIKQMFEHLNTLKDKQKQLKECDNVGNFNQGTI